MQAKQVKERAGFNSLRCFPIPSLSLLIQAAFYLSPKLKLKRKNNQSEPLKYPCVYISCHFHVERCFGGFKWTKNTKISFLPLNTISLLSSFLWTSRVFEKLTEKRRWRKQIHNEVELQCLFLRLKKINKVNIRVIDSDHLALAPFAPSCPMPCCSGSGRNRWQRVKKH